MGYFILSQDKTYKNQVAIDKSRLPEELQQKASLRSKNYYECENRFIGDKSFNLIVKSNVNNYYSDFIEIPFLLISDELKKIFISYEASLTCNCTILSDRVNKIQKVYWLCALEMVDCLGADSKFYPDGSIKELVLDRAKIGNRKIFQVAGIREQRFIASLDVVESILRRPFTGICVEKATMEIN
jgi:hypothetical protein